MKNSLLKIHLINSSRADEKALIRMGHLSLIYKYQFSRSMAKQRIQHENDYDKSFEPLELIPFDYKGIEFNMIVCPTGGEMYVPPGDKSNVGGIWGNQGIKEPLMLGETEVTRQLFKAVMGFDYSESREHHKNPVANVTWFDCLEFCNRLSEYFRFEPCYTLKNKKFSNSKYPLSIEDAEFTFIEGKKGFRLPKEWEWIISAKAGTTNEYAGVSGIYNDEGELDASALIRSAWFDYNSKRKAHPVAQKLPNEWGFYDMTGNVSEWCETTRKPNDNNNPSAERMVHGGHYNEDASYIDIDNREAHPRSNRRENILGFRVARLA